LIKILIKGGTSLDRDYYLNMMPIELRATIESFGKKAPPEKVMEMITDLCSWRELSSLEIAKILIRDRVYIVDRYLKPLIHSGGLEYTIPNHPTDSNQAYRSRQPSQ
jgi:ATP-dependent DNA helicase RecG